MTVSIGTALLISIAVGVATVLNYTCSGGFKTAIVTGAITGLAIGKPDVGLQIGAYYQLLSMGFLPVGDTVIPNYPIGAIFGTVIAAMSGDAAQGYLIGVPISTLASWLTTVRQFIDISIVHAEQRALEKGNYKKINGLHTLGVVVSSFVTMTLPTFLGLLVINKYEIVANFINNYAWIKTGLSTVSGVLPAVGFALLLSFMDIKGYWPFMILGFVMYAYFGAGTLAIALMAVALAYLYIYRIKRNEGGNE